MDGFTRYTEAVQIICRICFDKNKLKGDLRLLTSIGEHIVRYYDINPEVERSFGFFPQRVCKGCASSILKGRPPKSREPEHLIISRKITTKHDSAGCPIFEIMTQTPRVGRPIMSKIESDISNNQATSISFKRASSYQSLDPELCRRCLASRKIGHDCTRKALIENVITVLQAKGIEDEVVAAILRRKAE